MEQELFEVLNRVIRHMGGGIVGSLEGINSSEVESFVKLVEDTVMHKLPCVIQPALEELIRSIAKEVIDTAFQKILTGNLSSEFHFSEQRRFRLKFKYKLFLPVWTGIPIKNELGTAIEVALVDSLTGKIIDSGPKASAKVEIVVVKGENDYDGGIDFEGFNRNIVREREGNKSLLGGDVYVDLKEGIGSVIEIHFAHSSNWMKNCTFRLGAKIVDNIYGNKVREAVTESFVIRDRRMKLYEKHEIPSLCDEVWRLKNISRRGTFCKCLREGNITTVKELLTEYFINPQKFQEICGTAVSGKKVKETVAHALKCGLDDWYIYYSSAPQKIGAVFNVVGQLHGALYGSHYVPIDKLSEEQKIEAHGFVVSAFKHWGEVSPLDKNYPSFDSSNTSSNAFYASNSHGSESLGTYNDGGLIMIDNHENAFSCNFYQDITSSNASDWSMKYEYHK